MKNSLLVMVVVVTILVGGVPWAIREAHCAGPVIQVVEINGHRTRFDNANPAFVRYLLIDPSNADPTIDGFAPIDPISVLMLFIGGDGTLNLTLIQQNTGSTNFLARTRYHFAAEGYVVALVDAASDFLAHNHDDTTDASGFLHGSGLRGHRLPNRLHGDKYLQDLAAVMNDLRGRYPNLPLWAVGTSQGTISAAVAATNVSPPPDGIVLTSSLTGPSALGDLQSVDLEAINVPALIVTNQDVGLGLVASLARPGGNVTGLSSLNAELNTKRLEILKDAVPKLLRVGLLWLSGQGLQMKELRPAALALELKLEEIGMRVVSCPTGLTSMTSIGARLFTWTKS